MNASKPFFLRSIRYQAVLLTAFMVIGLALLSGFYFSWHAKRLIFDTAIERIETVGKTFAFNAEYGLLLENREILSKLAQGVTSQESILLAIVLDEAGNVIAREPQPLDADTQEKMKQLFPYFEKEPDTPFKENLLRFGEVYLLSFPVYGESKKGSEELDLFESRSEITRERLGYTVIIFSPKSIYEKVQKIQIGVLSLFGVFSLAVMIFVFVITNFFVKQLNRLLEGMHQVKGGDLTVRVQSGLHNELGAVCEGFNQMAGVLEQTTVSRDALVKEIEERKKLEKIVLQSEKMSAIGQLAAGVAHEINNPLGVILGFSQGIAKRLEPGHPFEGHLKSIEREAIRCKQLVQDLLTFSRVGKTEAEKEPILIPEAIEGALSLVQAQAKVKDVHLTKTIEPGLPKIQAHRGNVQQVIINLCSNAIDAMPNGGHLKLNAFQVLMNHKPYVQIDIQDDGTGIPPDIQSKIFDPFFTTKEVGKGTGLGLSLVYEIVQKHQGQITLESELGKGTIFHVLLPLN